jgi:hypothetical protein
MSQKYINTSAIKKFVKMQSGKRVGKDFLDALDRHIENKLLNSSREHNGGKKTLDSGVAGFHLGNK